MRSLALVFLLAAALSAAAQSRRVVSTPTPAAQAGAGRTAKQMYDEVSGYLRAKAAEFEQKKIAFSDSLLERTKAEQKQLAARYAAESSGRELAGDELYFAGMLHWIAGSLDGAARELNRFVSSTDAAPERAQTARSVIAVVLAKQGKLPDAESMLAAYLKGQPVRLTERARIEGELAKAYQKILDHEKMAVHAVENYKAARDLLMDPSSRIRGLDEVLDAAMLVFEAYRDGGKRDLADAALDEMIATAAATRSTTFYYYALDQKIRYMIDTGRKPAATAIYKAIDGRIAADMPEPALQQELKARFKKRAKHYFLLGEPAPELVSVDQWFPGAKRTLADYKGKVVLLDFWATWCLPCLETFPHLREWREDLGPDGFEILGITRYYGTVNGLDADPPHEIDFLKTFREKHRLPYDLVVSRDMGTQLQYGATSLPTAVILDRKGIVRYIESGTSSERIEQMRLTIMRLLAEK